MNIVRRAVDSLAIVGLWAVLWAVVVATLFVIVGAIDPAVVGPEEGPRNMARKGASEGAMTGAAFAVLLGLFERRRGLAEIGHLRAIAWSVVAAVMLWAMEVTDVHLANGVLISALSAVACTRLLRSASCSLIAERPSCS